MVRLFIGILKGVAFDWFRSLPANAINCWFDLKTRFLSRFYENDTEVIMDTSFWQSRKEENLYGIP